MMIQNGEQIPARVRKSLDFLHNHQIWHVVSRNTPATSCRDAASRRYRLGTLGIPLSDELKSGCFVVYDALGERRFVLLHCRAHLRFNLEGVARLLKASRPLARLAHDELIQVFGAQYGTVHPFTDHPAIFLHIFDTSVQETSLPPHTMMTNAGEHTWAIEFNASELIEKLTICCPEKIQVEQITFHEAAHHTNKRFILGIITGNGPDSGMALWRHVNRFVSEGLAQDFRGDLSYPPVIVQSIPELGLSMELKEREQDVWRFLSAGVRSLCQQQVSHIALACNTTQYFTQQIRAICQEQQVCFVSMAETAVEKIQEQGIGKITIIGIPYVADLGRWSAYKGLSSLMIEPVKETVREALLELGYYVKKYGSDQRGLNKLLHILRAGVTTEHVLIALTEISILLEGFPKKQNIIGDWKIIDPLFLYGKELATLYLHTRIISEHDTSEKEDSFL